MHWDEMSLGYVHLELFFPPDHYHSNMSTHTHTHTHLKCKKFIQSSYLSAEIGRKNMRLSSS